MKKKEKLVKEKPRRNKREKFDPSILSKLSSGKKIQLSPRPTPFPNPNGYGPGQGFD